MAKKFILDVSKHCIETEIKQIHNRMVLKYVKLKKIDTELEEQIQALENALTHMDFSYLRSNFRALSGNSEQQAYLRIDSDHNHQIFINGNLVYQVQIP